MMKRFSVILVLIISITFLSGTVLSLSACGKTSGKDVLFYGHYIQTDMMGGILIPEENTLGYDSMIILPTDESIALLTNGDRLAVSSITGADNSDRTFTADSIEWEKTSSDAEYIIPEDTMSLMYSCSLFPTDYNFHMITENGKSSYTAYVNGEWIQYTKLIRIVNDDNTKAVCVLTNYRMLAYKDVEGLDNSSDTVKDVLILSREDL